MTDPYRFSDEPPSPAEPPAIPPGTVLRGLLWLLLVASAVGNTVASAASAGTPVQLALGLVTAACVVALIVLRLRRR
jgi:hypothetical protein